MVRPLIDVRRSEVEAFCRALGLRPRRDPTNTDTRLLRNAIRLEVLPTLERATGRDVKGPIARSARLLREHVDRFDPPSGPGPGLHSGLRPSDEYELHLAEFSDIEVRLRHIKEVLWNRVGASVTEAAVLAVNDLWEGRPGRRRDLGGGLIAVRRREYIQLSRTSPGGPVSRPSST
jgi:tRNA(Ile)-lysidine synthase